MTTVLCAMLALAVQAAAAAPVRVAPAEAAAHLRRYIAADYPPIARTAGVSGAPEVDIVIGADGAVRSATVVRGVPLLDPAATNAVRQWRYAPFVIDGRAADVVTRVVVPIGVPAADDPEMWVAPFVDQARRCEARLAQGGGAETEAECASARDLAKKLPRARQLERELAAHDVAIARFLTGRDLRSAGDMASADTALKDADAQLTAVHASVSAHRTPDAADAARWTPFGARVTASLRTVLDARAAVLDALGRTADAADVRKRIAAIK